MAMTINYHIKTVSRKAPKYSLGKHTLLTTKNSTRHSVRELAVLTRDS